MVLTCVFSTPRLPLHIPQTPSISVTSLLGVVGGNIGIMNGATLMTVRNRARESGGFKEPERGSAEQGEGVAEGLGRRSNQLSRIRATRGPQCEIDEQRMNK